MVTNAGDRDLLALIDLSIGQVTDYETPMRRGGLGSPSASFTR
ncbi:hypothetical protein ACWDUL_25930 [Nocardia niigatensis]|nr:hypothetical protein [Nocardia niigatensis]